MWRVIVETLTGQEYVYELNDAPALVHTNDLVSAALKAHSVNVAFDGAPLAVDVTGMAYEATKTAELTRGENK